MPSKNTEKRESQLCQECSSTIRETPQLISSEAKKRGGEAQVAVAHSRRAEARLQIEAKASRSRLQALIVGLRKPLSEGGLVDCATEASGLCSGIFEKTYLARLAARLTGIPTKQAELLGMGAELAMFSALTVDDWIDQTHIRSGSSAFHVRRGPAIAIITATCLGEAAHRAVRQICSNLPQEQRAKIEEAFSRSILGIQAGQAMVECSNAALASAGLLDRLARLRCGRLIGFVMGSVGQLSGNQSVANSLEEAGTWIGTALQHRNDIQDFTVSFKQRIKPPLADLLNGQPNLVLTHLFRHLDCLTSAERALLTKLHGRNKHSARKLIRQTEFTAVLRMVTKSRAGVLATKQLGRCVKKADDAFAKHFDGKSLREWRDYAMLLQNP